MNTMTLKSKTGKDGSLDLHLRTDIHEQTVDVVVVVQSLDRLRGAAKSSWPQGFIKRTAGCMASDPIQLQPQGAYEHREELR